MEGLPSTLARRCFVFFTLVTGSRRSFSLNLSDTKVYEPQIRDHLGTTVHSCRSFVVKQMEVAREGGAFTEPEVGGGVRSPSDGGRAAHLGVRCPFTDPFEAQSFLSQVCGASEGGFES